MAAEEPADVDVAMQAEEAGQECGSEAENEDEGGGEVAAGSGSDSEGDADDEGLHARPHHHINFLPIFPNHVAYFNGHIKAKVSVWGLLYVVEECLNMCDPQMREMRMRSQC